MMNLIYLLFLHLLSFSFSKYQTGILFFAANLFALALAILIDIFFPGRYYTVREIFNVPLIVVYISFVGLTWFLYFSRIWHKISDHQILTRTIKGIFNLRIRFVLKIIVISVVSYLYIFTFVIWSELSTEEVHAQTLNKGQRDIPWYLYPMKLGIAGLLGIAFIISYLFKRFEKEIFIFGIIAIISFLTGPYYDEHRMSKYIMLGMVGFASLLIHKIIIYSTKNRNVTSNTKPFLVRGVLIGLVITSSSLSTLLYIGYSVRGLENPSFKPFNTTLTARHFPCPQKSTCSVFYIIF